ncbi:MAG: hypothetical protein ACLPUO_25120 [Streptosporangiaceae bacterium]
MHLVLAGQPPREIAPFITIRSKDEFPQFVQAIMPSQPLSQLHERVVVARACTPPKLALPSHASQRASQSWATSSPASASGPITTMA